MIKKVIFSLVLVFSFLSVAKADRRTNPLKILVAGQSNCHFAASTNVYSTSGHVWINRDYLVQSNFTRPTITNQINHSKAMLKLGDLLWNQYGVSSIFIMCSVGSTTSAQWAGGATNYWIRIATTAVVYKPDAILWIQGEGDTSLAVSSETYRVNLSSIVANVRNYGVTAPIFIAIDSQGHYPPSYEQVRLGQYLTLRDASLTNLIPGPDLDQIRTSIGNVYEAGYVHFYGNGFDYHAELWKKILAAHFRL